jgi:protocatechuate 3,4-dioxygenase beta subunit
MKSLTRFIIASALLLCAVSLQRALPQTQTPKKTQGATVAGKVTIKGKPATGIMVGMRTSLPTGPFEPTFKAKTDQEGRYRITDVPAGAYQVWPSAPAYVLSDVNQQRNQTVVLSEGENVDGIDFSLVRGGVITGKVTDAEGHPLIEQRVSLFRADPPPNQRGPIYPISGVQTDDRGIYRMFGVAEGRYKVAVGQGDEGYYIQSAAGRFTYKQTFYPDVADASKATVVEVTEGSEASNIDITVGRAEQTFVASGRVVDGDNNQPIAGARFGVQLIISQERRSYVGVTAFSNSKGEFRIESLTPGKYVVFLQPQQDSDLRSDPVTFEIIDQDVSGLVVKTVRGAATLAGNIVIENTDDKAVFANLLKLRVQGYVQNQNQTPNVMHTSTIYSDGSFVLSGLEPGAAHLSLGAQDRTLLKGFTVTHIERDGAAQLKGVEVKNGDQITGVRMFVSYGNAIVRGVVKLADGTLPAGARFYIRVMKDGDRRSNIRPPQVDSRGHFIIEALPGGLYDFEASVFVPGGGRPRPPVKQQVSVPDGGVTEVTITVEVNPPPGPTP